MKKKYKRFANACFVWGGGRNRHAQTPLKTQGKTLENRTVENYKAPSWLGDPMPHFVAYVDGGCGIEIINNVQKRKDIIFAVGGIALFPFLSFEGFKGSNINGLEGKTNRLLIAYNPTTNKIALCGIDNVDIYEARSRLLELGYTVILGLDSGGSAQRKFKDHEHFTSRIMAGWLVWEE